jgi:ATP-dependent DNA helicase RecG
LVSDSVLAKKRLKILTESSDGFYIAEKDLETRGPGDFFGTRQSGVPLFKLADPTRDAEIFKSAALESKKYLLKKTGAVVL